MFHQVVIKISSDNQGQQYAGIRRYDNHGKMGFTGNLCGNGRMYQSSNVQRIASTLVAMGYHFMHNSGEGITYGKFVA